MRFPLNRYAANEDLNVAIPAKGNYLSSATLFNKSVFLDTPWNSLQFQVFTLHNRWNYDDLIALMGYSTKIFTIVRDPVDLFESMYSYAHLGGSYGNLSLKDFIRAISTNQTFLKTTAKNRKAGRFGRNQISWDLGIEPSRYDDKQFIAERIKEFDAQFQLVMVAERFEESLILLRHLLCWPIEHVTHLVLNQRKKEKTVELTWSERLILKDWLQADYQIYDYYVKVFDEKVNQFNRMHERNDGCSFTPAMQEEVAWLKEADANLKSRCVIDQVGNEKLRGKYQETSNDIMGYVINE